MRYLIYALQSSGASFFTFLLCQKPNTIGIIDLNNQEVAPSYKEFDLNIDVFVKCTVSKNFNLKDHIKSFMPNKTIFFDRNHDNVVNSLLKKSYANIGGNPYEKIENFKLCKTNNKFDYFYSYSEMLTKTPIDLIKPEYYSLKRSLFDIVNFNITKSKWCREYIKNKWFVGNIYGANECCDVDCLKNIEVRNPFL